MMHGGQACLTEMPLQIFKPALAGEGVSEASLLRSSFVSSERSGKPDGTAPGAKPEESCFQTGK